MEKQYEDYDVSQLYKDEIEPLLLQIKTICIKNKIPFFSTCAIKNYQDEKNGGVTEYANDGVLTGSNSIGLYHDKIEKILLVLKGVELTNPGAINQDEINQIERYMSDYEKVAEQECMFFIDEDELEDEHRITDDIGDISNIYKEILKESEAASSQKKKRGRPKKSESK